MDNFIKTMFNKGAGEYEQILCFESNFKCVTKRRYFKFYCINYTWWLSMHIKNRIILVVQQPSENQT